jgi:hypothetical protein
MEAVAWAFPTGSAAGNARTDHTTITVRRIARISVTDVIPWRGARVAAVCDLQAGTFSWVPLDPSFDLSLRVLRSDAR